MSNFVTNYVFPCASVNGLTLNQKREALKALRVAITEEATIRRMVRADAKAAKEAAKAEKAAAREAKRVEAIARLEARLAKLQRNASKKPGPVKVFSASEIAQMNAGV